MFLKIFFSICFGKTYEKLKWSGLDQIWNIAFKIPESAVLKTSYWNWLTNFEVWISSFCCQKNKNFNQFQQAFLRYCFENKIKLRSNILKFSPCLISCCLESLLVTWPYYLKICSIILITYQKAGFWIWFFRLFNLHPEKWFEGCPVKSTQIFIGCLLRFF